MIKKFGLYLCYFVISISGILFLWFGVLAFLNDLNLIHYTSNIKEFILNENNSKYIIPALIAVVPSSILAIAAIISAKSNKIGAEANKIGADANMINAEANRNRNKLEKAKNLRAALREFRDKDRDIVLELCRYNELYELYLRCKKQSIRLEESRSTLYVTTIGEMQHLSQEIEKAKYEAEEYNKEIGPIRKKFPILRKESQLIESSLLSEISNQFLIQKIKDHFKNYVNDFRPVDDFLQKTEDWVLSSADIEDDFHKIIRELEQDL